MAETISLNEDQKRAVTFSGRNLLVSAGAGTGKTRVLVERFLYFVTEQRVPVDRILALTYTEKAANEMRSRIQKRLRELGREEDLRGLESAYISTIHAFCARLLKEHPVEAGVDPEFRVAEEETADFLIAQSMAEVCESLCGTDREIFDLLRAFGQEKITHGILKVLTAAKREARTLEEYFAVYPAASPGKKTFEKVSSLLRELGAEDRIPDWEVFLKDEDWDWKKITDYKNWQKGFSRNKKTPWPEVKELVRELLELRLFPHVLRSRKVFERLAIAFEAHYEKKKNEQGLLDFEDLQVRALRMLERPDKASRRLYGDLRKKFNQVLVDEFQDTDPLQLRLIETISSGTNLLLVGDYKQSIYRFRGAEPSLFLAQERRYRKQDAGERMTLAKNFRSRPEVLEFVNGLFGRLWGGAGTFYEPLEAVREGWGKTAVESIVIEAEEEEDESLDAGRMREAEAIARRILALTEEGVDYGEIAVLFPAVSQLGIYEQAFRQHGIPYYAVSGRGFYHQPEIRDITSYLSFLEDPARDVAVAASLRSPMFQIAGDTLFWLSHYAKSVWSRDSAAPLWNGVERFAEIPEISEPEKEKLSRFLRITSELAVEKDRLRLAELMDKILAGTSYGLTVLADPNGVRRYANLRKLSRLARTLESSGPMPLGLFIYTLKRLEMQEVREGEAQVEAETAGKVVRIMSVHKAKGLEFPVVFVADMGRSRRGESDETFLCDYQQGFSFRLRNERLRDWEDPAPWRRIKEVLKKRTEEEWERLFYVAVTRAKDRLILSGVYERPKKEKESSPSWIGTCQLAEKELASFCKRWEGTEGARRRPRGRDPRQVLLKRFGDFKPRSDEEILGGKKEAETVRERALSILKNTMPFEKPADKVIDLPVSAYAAYAKSAADYRRVYEIGYPDAREFEERLDTNGSEEVSAADFGTTFHRFMEKLDFRASRAAAMKRLEKRFESLGPKSATRARAMLERFMDSGLLKALRAAAEIHREIPFLLNERRGLIHGVIDVLFRDPDGSWHVLDYKTGEGSEEKILRSGYDRQVDLYAHAVAKILKIPPVSGILYFFGNGWQYDRPIDREVAKRIEAELRRTQEELLETRQKIG